MPISSGSTFTDGAHGPPGRTGHCDLSSSRRRRRVVGGSLTILALILVLFVGDTSALRIFATDVGERESVELPDGTAVTLNTDSEVHSVCNGNNCQVELIRGEALFDTRRTRSERSPISAGSIRISGPRSLFSARIESGETRITVAKGNVVVSSLFAYHWSIHEGQRVVFRYFGGQERTQTDNLSQDELGRNLSWQFGQLEFYDEPLGLAVSEINRYNRTHIELIGPFDTERLNGRFASTDPLGFARSIALIYPNVRLEIDDSPPDHRVLRLRRLVAPGKPLRQNSSRCEHHGEDTSPENSCSIHWLGIRSAQDSAHYRFR